MITQQFLLIDSFGNCIDVLLNSVNWLSMQYLKKALENDVNVREIRVKHYPIKTKLGAKK
jgi:hypothetical protein